MKFIAKLFSCNPKDKNESKKTFMSSLCQPKIQTCQPLNPSKALNKGQMIPKSISMSSRPFSTFSSKKSIKPMKLNLLTMNQQHESINYHLELGQLIGTISFPAYLQKSLSQNITKIQIGHDKQINYLGSLRPKCVDCLVIGWNETGWEYKLESILKSRQRLVFIVEDQEGLDTLLKDCEEELIRSSGEFCLFESVERIYFNIVTDEKYVAIQFLEKQYFISQFSIIFKNCMGFQIQEGYIEPLFQKMSLKDFINVKKLNKNCVKLINQYIRQIDREQAEQKAMPIHIKLEQTKSIQRMEVQNQQEIQKVQFSKEVNRASSNSSFERIFFEGKNIDSQPAPLYTEQQLKHLEIYYYNIDRSEDQETSIHQEIKPQKFFLRKKRSKSEDVTYITEETIDDELFQKYQ